MNRIIITQIKIKKIQMKTKMTLCLCTLYINYIISDNDFLVPSERAAKLVYAGKTSFLFKKRIR